MFFIVFHLACTEVRKEKFMPGINEPLMEMTSITMEAGSFWMGSEEYGIDEQPKHEVELTHSFEMMKTEMTQSGYHSIMGENPSFFSKCGDDCPVEKVRWIDVIQLSNRLNEALGMETCYLVEERDATWPKGYECTGWRLPTEAEWEYVVDKAMQSENVRIRKIAWYKKNSSGYTHPVCSKNETMGFCDLLGNVQEWVWDRPDAYSKDAVIDPLGGEGSSHRSFRGGAWNRYPENINWKVRKEANVFFRNNDLGFRLVRTLP